MPKSLSLYDENNTGSVKRQRSADANGRSPEVSETLQRPALASLPDTMRPSMKMPAYLQKSRSEITATFNELEWRQRFRLFHAMENETSPYKVDRSPIVINRNRYGNVQPWDASRIKLKTPVDGSDYVNASPIVLKSRNQQTASDNSGSVPQSVRYIATQGPKLAQKSHFWHMVHQEIDGEKGVIIMLTQMIEDNKEKCAQYYPTDFEASEIDISHEDGGASESYAAEQSESSTDTTGYGNKSSAPASSDTVTLVSMEYDAETRCDVRTFKLVINGESKTILHYLFGHWPDFGKPDANDRQALIKLSKKTYADANGTPRIVHCSAGVGRTGTWIALDFLIREIEEGSLFESVSVQETLPSQEPSNTDEQSKQETWGKSGPIKVNTPTLEDGFNKDEPDPIFETVDMLREQRMMMVVREVQYSFLYDVVKEVVLQKYGDNAYGTFLKDADTPEPQAYPRKQPRVLDVGHDRDSDAETEIIDDNGATVSQNEHGTGEDEDPYGAVSPEMLKRHPAPT